MKIAIVTGASGNLGLAVVKKFIEEGYKVIGTIIPNDSVKIDFPEQSFERVVVDVASEYESEKFIDSVIKKYRGVDVAVLTVGGYAMGKITETKTSDINKQYRLNFETTYNMARPVFSQMLKQNGGRIFMIGSKPGLNAINNRGMVAYGLAKSLIFRLSELMNDEAKGKNVVTSVIVPGTIDTPQNRQSMPDAHFNDWVKPEEIAGVISYYSSDAASAIREAIIKVYNNG